MVFVLCMLLEHVVLICPRPPDAALVLGDFRGGFVLLRPLV